MMSCPLRISDRPAGSRWIACALALLLWLLAGERSFAQEVEPEAGEEVAPGKEVVPGKEEEPKKPDPKAAAAKAAAAARKAAELEKAREKALQEILEGATELTPAQVANFEKWIPHTFARLRDRKPVHIVALGDSVTRYMSYDENRENSHHAYHGVFAAKLADEFFYTGGVRDIRPTMGHAEKLTALLGPDLTLENLGMNGRVSLHALSRITTDGLVNRPDLVLINFGINDALLGMGLATYVEALERSVRYVKSTGADVILLGPSHTLRNDTESELALTRPYSGAMEELAARLGVFYFDLGGVTMSAPGTRANSSLATIASAQRERYFNHGPENNDGLHPCPEAHQLMGAAIFKALRDGAPAEPYRLDGFVALGSGGKAVFEFKMKNLQDSAASGQVLVLPVAGMASATSAIPFELAAGKGKVFRVNFQVEGDRAFDFPADAARVFVPLIVTDAQRTYSPVIPAKLSPLGVVWETGAQDLTSSGFDVNCELVSASSAAVAGTYQANWNGQTASGKVALPAGKKQALALHFEVPAASGKFSVRDDLVLTVTAGDQVLKFVRNLEVSRNLGLGESVSMMNPTTYLAGGDSADGRVKLMAEANEGQLVLNFDVDNIPLEADDQQTPLILEFQLDARAYGKRRKFGYVDIVRVKFGIDGVAERMGALRLAVFGDWYDRTLDNDALTAGRTILPNGTARYSVTVPRSYLYLHEFALGNGNSTLGINADLKFAKAGQPDDPYPPDRHFKLVDSGLNMHSAESLTVLELVEQATGRWSLRLD